MLKRFAKGKRKTPGTMNNLEKAYSEILTGKLHAGQIQWFKYEAITLKLGQDCRYTPDFVVMLSDDTIELHETKGFMQDDALVKLKTAAEMFPFRVVLVTRQAKKDGGAWEYRHIGYQPKTLMEVFANDGE